MESSQDYNKKPQHLNVLYHLNLKNFKKSIARNILNVTLYPLYPLTLSIFRKHHMFDTWLPCQCFLILWALWWTNKRYNDRSWIKVNIFFNLNLNLILKHLKCTHLKQYDIVKVSGNINGKTTPSDFRDMSRGWKAVSIKLAHPILLVNLNGTETKQQAGLINFYV